MYSKQKDIFVRKIIEIFKLANTNDVQRKEKMVHCKSGKNYYLKS